MHIYNGDLRDISNRKSRSFLQINSCGIQQPVSGQMITYRQKGRCDYHILYVASGKCEITYEGKTHVLKHGFVLYPPHIRQKYIDHENTLRMWIHFTGYDIEEILSDVFFIFWKSQSCCYIDVVILTVYLYEIPCPAFYIITIVYFRFSSD